MLRIRLFKWYALLIIAFGLISALMAVRLIADGVVREAQMRVVSDLRGAHAVQKGTLDEIEVALEIVAAEQPVVHACRPGTGTSDELRERLETIRQTLQLDFLTLVTSDAVVVARAAGPSADTKGDRVIPNKVIARALQGQETAGTDLMLPEELEREQAGLSRRAFIKIHETAYALPTAKTEERRGMILISAVPVKDGAQVQGALYGGILLNNNNSIVDRIRDMVFKDEQYAGKDAGTVTIFLDDSRIATTVRLEEGSRALGTRVSEEVAERVLGKGKRWEGRAFVVRDWYLTAYEPIRDMEGTIIGMLYVGLLERPYKDLIRDTIYKYILLSVVVLALALVIAFFLASKIARPLHVLADAAQQMNSGHPFTPVVYKGASRETDILINSFNDMVKTLTKREASLQQTNQQLETANRDLETLNYNYMEAVGFVSHELRSPLSAIMNYAYLMMNRKIGPLTEKQEASMNNINMNVRRLLDMVHNYLNLSRIEQGQFKPVVTNISMAEEVLQPLCDSFREEAEKHGMALKVDMAAQVTVEADLNMVREIFDNLVSNAIKYGREGGTIEINAQRSDDFFRFSVSNEGEGIPEEKLNRLFRKFSRMEGIAETRAQKGSGLGLFITKHIVEAHGGTIQVESYPGKGVTVVFTLPMGKEKSKSYQ